MLPLPLPRSTVRDAMVRIMLAGGSRQHPQHHIRRGGVVSSSKPSSGCEQRLVGEGGGDARQTAFGEMSTKNVDGGCQSDVLAADRGTQVLPRDSSTCMLWCAVALGALVRGYPLAQVGVYLPCYLSFPLNSRNVSKHLVAFLGASRPHTINCGLPRRCSS